jgi:hypothetical protein
VTLLVIGPKVDVSEEPDEDATQFMRVADLPKALAGKGAGTATQAARRQTGAAPAAANPLRAAAQAKAVAEATPAAPGSVRLWLGGTLILVLGVVLGALSMRLLG